MAFWMSSNKKALIIDLFCACYGAITLSYNWLQTNHYFCGVQCSLPQMAAVVVTESWLRSDSAIVTDVVSDNQLKLMLDHYNYNEGILDNSVLKIILKTTISDNF